MARLLRQVKLGGEDGERGSFNLRAIWEAKSLTEEDGEAERRGMEVGRLGRELRVMSAMVIGLMIFSGKGGLGILGIWAETTVVGGGG